MRLWLKEARKAAGLTQSQLAILVDINITTVGKYENGTRRPSPEVAQNIADVLDFDWKIFFETGGKDETRKTTNKRTKSSS